MYTFSLIKKGDIHLGKKKIIRAKDFSEFMKTKELIEEAEKEAEALHETTLKECEKIKEKAKEDGFQEGLVKFNSHILFLDEEIKVLRHETQKAILPIVLKAVKRIIGEEIELRPEMVVGVVIQAVKSVVQCQFVKLYVNKEDMQILEESKEKIKQVFEKLESFRIEERPDVPRGSCIIETERGILNATLENQYRALERALEGHLRKT